MMDDFFLGGGVVTFEWAPGFQSKMVDTTMVDPSETSCGSLVYDVQFSEQFDDLSSKRH